MKVIFLLTPVNVKVKEILFSFESSLERLCTTFEGKHVSKRGFLTLNRYLISVSFHALICSWLAFKLMALDFMHKISAQVISRWKNEILLYIVSGHVL